MGYNWHKLFMKKTLFLPCIAITALMFFSSCGGVKQTFLPQSTNMIHTVSFEDLKLTSNDYDILSRVEATSRMILTINGTELTIVDPDGTFMLKYLYNPVTKEMTLADFEGALRGGFLAGFSKIDLKDPEDIARRFALYRLINLVREQGGDYIIEPVYSINVEGGSENKITKITNITYMTTISGKAIRLKTSK